MSICSLGIGNATLYCKYGKNHRIEQCPLCELELKVNALNDRLNSIFNNMKAIDPCDIKNPHKCPVCEGSGKLPPVLFKNDCKEDIYLQGQPIKGGNIDYYRSPCNACEGKGIVWR